MQFGPAANWTGDLDGMLDRKLIRILVPYSKTIYFIDLGEELGTAVEIGRALERWVNKERRKEVDKVRIAFVPVARAELISALVAGRGDVISADLTVTPERLRRVDFSAPFASGVSEVLVSGPAAQKLDTLDDLGGKEVFVRRSSSYFEHLMTINAGRKATGKSEIILREMDENLEDEDVLEMVNAGILPWAIADRFNAMIWKQVLENLVVREDIAISTGGDLAFGIRKDSPKLAKMLATFVK